MAELSVRLAAVARHVPCNSIVADIGTDHAFLPVYLIQQRKALRVVAGEVVRGPYDVALKTIRSFKLEDTIDLRLGNGLDVLSPGEVDVVVLAGMGGKTVCSILSEGSAVLQRLNRMILQPMRDVPLVRRWLVENGWCLIDEEMVREDGHYYVIIAAEPGKENSCDNFALQVGPRLLEKRDRVFRGFLEQRLDRISKMLVGLEISKARAAKEKILIMRNEAEKIREVLQDWSVEQRN